MKFRIRSLFVLITCVAIAIPSTPLIVAYIRSLRPVDAIILVKFSAVREILPSVQQHSANLSGIYGIKRDDRTNTIIVTSRARDCEANANAISDFIAQLDGEYDAATVESLSPSSIP